MLIVGSVILKILLNQEFDIGGLGHVVSLYVLHQIVPEARAGFETVGIDTRSFNYRYMQVIVGAAVFAGHKSVTALNSKTSTVL